MGKEIKVRIVLRHNTTAGWAEVGEKEVLRKGEIGLEFNQSSNVPKMKIGDGVRPWNGLPYFSADLPETFNWGLLKGTLFEGKTEKIEEGSFAGLTKPAYKDNADISVINKNFDILKTNIEELQNKTYLQGLLSSKSVDRFIVLSSEETGKLRAVYDKNLRRIK